MSAKASVKGSVKGSVKDGVKGSVKASAKGSVRGSLKGSQAGSKRSGFSLSSFGTAASLPEEGRIILHPPNRERDLLFETTAISTRLRWEITLATTAEAISSMPWLPIPAWNRSPSV